MLLVSIKIILRQSEEESAYKKQFKKKTDHNVRLEFKQMSFEKSEQKFQWIGWINLWISR